MIHNITIIGNGAIGSLWAQYLSDDGYNVTVVGRKPNATVLTLRTIDGHELNHHIDYLANTVPLNSDLVIVTTKAYQINDALNPYLARLAHCPIVLMHNGLGAAQQLAVTTLHQLYLATTSHGALVADGICQHTGLGSTMIGCFNHDNKQQALAIATVLNSALPSVEYVPNIDRALWQKLAINCAINPLTALHDCRNGELALPQFSQQLDAITQEVSQLATALKLDLPFHTLRNTIDQVINKTANNFSSMHQDVANKRITEIDYINGFVVKQGKELGIATPHNEEMWLAVKRLNPLS